VAPTSVRGAPTNEWARDGATEIRAIGRGIRRGARHPLRPVSEPEEPTTATERDTDAAAPAPGEVPAPAQDAPPRAPADPDGEPVDLRRVFRLWAPLAASWILMAMEPTLVIAAVSRLEGAKVTLAAWSSVVFPISLVVEGPIIMMLAASTRLATSWGTYAAVMRYGHTLSLALTVLHGLIAFTPLYDLVAIDLLGSKPEVLEPGRLGLQIMLPWTFMIGYRRAQQGTLIRFERSGVVSQGTALRLATSGAVLFGLPYLIPGIRGIVLAAIGTASGVTAEALFAGVRVREVWPRLQQLTAERGDEPMPLGRFLRFYTPLALTPLITLLIQPIGASAMNRMPRPLDSVAAWGPVHALVFTMRSVGMAFNEVVVTLVALPGGARSLKRFGLYLGLAASSVIALIWATPLSDLWFGFVQSIPAELVPIATVGAGMGFLMPAYQVAQSWFTGVLVHRQTTRPITEAVSLYFLIATALLLVGVRVADDLGVMAIAWTVGSFVFAGLCQTGWLWWRSRECAPADESA